MDDLLTRKAIAWLRGVLQKQAILDDTVIVWSSDHGFFLGEHRFYDKRISAHRPNFIPQCQGELGSSGELSQRSPAFSAHARHCAGRGRISSDGPRGVSMSWRQ